MSASQTKSRRKIKENEVLRTLTQRTENITKSRPQKLKSQIIAARIIRGTKIKDTKCIANIVLHMKTGNEMRIVQNSVCKKMKVILVI